MQEKSTLHGLSQNKSIFDNITEWQIFMCCLVVMGQKRQSLLIQNAPAKGYFVTLVFFWLNSPELAIERVKSRVNSGGHKIPEDVIRRRYNAGINNLSKLYLPICDYWLIIDNSEPPFQIVAEGFKTANIEIHNQITYNQIVKL